MHDLSPLQALGFVLWMMVCAFVVGYWVGRSIR